MTTMPQICELFVLAAEACAAVHGKPLPKRLLVIGDRDRGWCVQLNNTDAEVDGIEAVNAIVWWNGFPAGAMDPFGGVIAAGELFRKWLEDMVQAN